jgi:porin
MSFSLCAGAPFLRGRRRSSVSAAVSFLALMPSLAWAEAVQQPIEPGGTGTPSITGEKPVNAQQGYGVPGEDPGYLFNLAPIGAPLGRFLGDYGIYPHVAMQQTGLGVVSGGNKNADYVNLAYWGFALDTQKAFGLPGGLFDFTFSTQFGNTAEGSNSTGSEAFFPYAFGDEMRLVNFDYNQSFWHHALQIQVGRTQIGFASTPYLSPAFHQTQWYCTFFTFSCGEPNAFGSDSSKEPYDVGSWGGAVTVHPAPFWYVKGGVFENQTPETTSRNHLGWPGGDWGFKQASGAIFPAQFGYITTPATSPYPTNFHFGGFYDNAKFPDKLFNAKGQVAALHPGAPMLDQGTDGLFAGLQQTVYRFSDDPRSTRGISLFFGADWDLHSKEAVQQQYSVGTIVTGPFASRAADTFNVLFSIETFEGRFRASRDAVAAKNGVNYRMAPTQTVAEVNYGIAAAPGMTVFPFIQYIVDPDQLDMAVPNPKITDALAVGLRAVIRFDTLFGFPQPS